MFCTHVLHLAGLDYLYCMSVVTHSTTLGSILTPAHREGSDPSSRDARLALPEMHHAAWTVEMSYLCLILLLQPPPPEEPPPPVAIKPPEDEPWVTWTLARSEEFEDPEEP